MMTNILKIVVFYTNQKQFLIQNSRPKQKKQAKSSLIISVMLLYI